MEKAIEGTIENLKPHSESKPIQKPVGKKKEKKNFTSSSEASEEEGIRVYAMRDTIVKVE